MTRKPPNDLSEQLYRYYESCAREGEEQLSARERGGSQKISAEINEGYLYYGYCAHYEYKGAVFGDARKNIKSVNARIEALHNAEEDKESKKCAEKYSVLRVFTKMRDEEGML